MKKSDAFLRTIGGFAIAATLFAAPSIALADDTAYAEGIGSPEPVGAAIQEGAITWAAQPLMQDFTDADGSTVENDDTTMEAATNADAAENEGVDADVDADESFDADADANVEVDAEADADANVEAEADVDADAEAETGLCVIPGWNGEEYGYDKGVWGVGYTCGSRGYDAPNPGVCPGCAERHNQIEHEIYGPDYNDGESPHCVNPSGLPSNNEATVVDDCRIEISDETGPLIIGSPDDNEEGSITYVRVVHVAEPIPVEIVDDECECDEPGQPMVVHVTYVSDEYDYADEEECAYGECAYEDCEYDDPNFDEADGEYGYDEYDYGEADYDEFGFDDADYDESDFGDADLDDRDYDEADFDEVDYDEYECDYDDADYDDANYDDANIDDCNYDDPDFDEADFDEREYDSDEHDFYDLDDDEANFDDLDYGEAIVSEDDEPLD